MTRKLTTLAMGTITIDAMERIERVWAMSLVDSFDLSDYETIEEVKELLERIADEQSTLRGFYRGASEKLDQLEQQREES